MRIKDIPDLENGHILKKSMLIALRDAALYTNDLLHKNYSNGILSGCELEVTEDSIIVKPGVIFFENQIFDLKRSLSIGYRHTSDLSLLKLCFSGELRDAEGVYREAELKLTNDSQICSDELELCRFKLQEGARLRNRYQSFEDLNTEFDTVNRIYVPSASEEQETLLPEITRMFAREMLLQSDIKEFDALFCLQILGEAHAMRKEALVKYIEISNRKEIESYSNICIYENLLKILNQQVGRNKKVSNETRTWKMMIE